MKNLDPEKARTCNACGTPMVPYRPGAVVPDGYRRHSAHGLCSSCYRAPSAQGPRVARPTAPGEKVLLPTFHRYAPPPPWTVEALCAQTDPEVFFPEKGGRHQTGRAKAVCAACPVTTVCLQYAIANREEFGVWGGTSPEERRELWQEAA